jgi:photosystem II stability/assembly factor-like uncharacterized protein
MGALAQQPAWRVCKGTENVWIAAIAASWTSPETLYAFGGMFLRSVNGGESWDSISNLGTDVGALKVDPTNSQVIYASHYGWDPSSNDISVSSDGGYTWSFAFHGRRSPAPVVEVDPVDHKTVYVGVGPGLLWRTSDQAKTWEYSGGVPTNSLLSVAIDPINDSIIWAATSPSIMKSTDRGSTWLTVMTTPVHTWDQIAINPKNPSIVYVSFYDTLAGGIYKTTDGGVSWQDANGDLPHVNRGIYRMVLNPRNPDEIFLGASTPTFDRNPFVFRTTDGGLHWLPFSSGLPDSTGHIESMFIDTISNRVFVGVSSQRQTGLYVCGCTTSVNNYPPLPQAIMLYQNYPNPFNPQTTIRFLLQHETDVKLEVIDLLGRSVATLVGEKMMRGEHEARFDATSFPSGAFFYRLQTSGATLIRKLMVIK